MVLVVPCGDLLGDFLEGIEMGVGIAVAEFMIGDDGDSAGEEGGEFGVKHGGRLGSWVLMIKLFSSLPTDVSAPDF